MKRVLDLTCLIAAALLLGPVFALIALAIWLDDRGPIFFRQERIGRYFHKFQIVKFRTMRNGRVTRVGAWLRQQGLDELPQILNIFNGEMSVVGPRPLTCADIQRLYEIDEETAPRWNVKPGLTGLAQINSGRGLAISRAADLRYVRECSLWLDLRIILISFVVNVFGKRRVRRWFYGRSET